MNFLSLELETLSMQSCTLDQETPCLQQETCPLRYERKLLPKNKTKQTENKTKNTKPPQQYRAQQTLAKFGKKKSIRRQRETAELQDMSSSLKPRYVELISYNLGCMQLKPTGNLSLIFIYLFHIEVVLIFVYVYFKQINLVLKLT